MKIRTHIQAGGPWHEIASTMRDSRTRLANANTPAAKSKVANAAEKDKKAGE